MDSIALLVVVELDPEEVKLRVGDHLLHVEILILKRAFGGTADEVVSLDSIEELTETVDHGNVPA